MIKTIIRGIALAVAGTLVVTAAAGAHPRLAPALPMWQAHGTADRLALNNLDPNTLLPSYSAATSWDRTDDGSNACLRWARYRIDCTVTTVAENYYYDPLLEDYTGYAYCVTNVKVTKNPWSGRVVSQVTDFHPQLDCGSTPDYS